MPVTWKKVSSEDTIPVDSYLEFANDYGVADTLGNILEWTLDSLGGM